MANKRFLRGGVLLLFIILGVYTVYVNWNQTGGRTQAEIGKQAPDFNLYSTQNQQIKLSDFKGKMVVLNFWGYWCEPCRDEMPALQSVYEKYKEKGLVILGIHMRQEAVPVNQFVNQYQVTFPILYDTPDKLTALDYHVDPLPSTVIIAPDGTVLEQHVGQIQAVWLEERVKTILVDK